MVKRILLCGSAIVLILTACGERHDKPGNDVNAIHEKLAAASTDKPAANTEFDFDKHVAFERKYLPIVEKAIKDLFSDVSNFEPYGTYYIDDSGSNLKIIFLLDQPNDKQVKQLRKVLQEEMGDKVDFRLPEHSYKKLQTIQNEISKTLEGMKLQGGWSVSSDIVKQKVVVEAHLTEAQRSEITDHYGSDLVEIKISGIVIAMDGYVVKINNGKILVVSPVVQDYGAQGGESYHYGASWYSNAPSGVKVGQKVEVKVIEGPTTAQYPGDSTAEEVIIIPSTKPENAALSEEEAIRKALESDEYQQSKFSKSWLPVVKDTKFEENQSIWTVYFTNEGTDKVLPIQVKEK